MPKYVYENMQQLLGTPLLTVGVILLYTAVRMKLWVRKMQKAFPEGFEAVELDKETKSEIDGFLMEMMLCLGLMFGVLIGSVVV